MSESTLSSGRNQWITRAGVAVFIALAVGLILSSGGPVGAAGYGPRPGTPACSGYHVTCNAQVASVATAPRTPTAGNGFTVKFKTTSGGTYAIKARRNGAAKATALSSGAAGTGDMAIKKLGKKLKAGVYSLVVTVKSGTKTAKATHKLTIKK